MALTQVNSMERETHIVAHNESLPEGIEKGPHDTEPLAQPLETIAKATEIATHELESDDPNSLPVVEATERILLHGAENAVIEGDVHQNVVDKVQAATTFGLLRHEGILPKSNSENVIAVMEHEGLHDELVEIEERFESQHVKIGNVDAATEMKKIIEGHPDLGAESSTVEYIDNDVIVARTGELSPVVAQEVFDAKAAEKEQVPMDVFVNEFTSRSAAMRRALDNGDQATFSKISSETRYQIKTEDFQKTLRAGVYSPSELNTIITASAESDGMIYEELYNRYMDPSEQPVQHNAPIGEVFAQLSKSIPSENLKELYDYGKSDTGNSAVGEMFASVLERSDSSGEGTKLGVLAKINGFDSAFEAYKVNKLQPIEDPSLAALLERPSLILEADEYSQLIEPRSGELPFEARARFENEFLCEVLNLEPTLADDIRFSARHKSHRVEGGERHLKEIARKVESIGSDSANKLHESAGIINIHRYTDRQLKTMVGFIDNDAETMDRLRQGEVTLALSDGTEDWNEAFHDTGAILESSHGRTLIFEVSNIGRDTSDLSKYAEMMKQKDIHPTRMMITAHGSPGHMAFRDTALTNLESSAKDNRTNVFSEATGMTEIVDQMAESDDGYRHVILASCSQAAEYQVANERKESTAETFAKQMGNGSRVYASGVPNMMFKTANGQVRHSKDGRVFTNPIGGGTVTNEPIRDFNIG